MSYVQNTSKVLHGFLLLISRARISLAGQMFTARMERGKERLVTIDRFLWHGGIKKRDVISSVTRKEVSALPFCDVGDQQ